MPVRHIAQYLVVAFSLRSFLEGEGQVKVDPLPSATATKLLQETGISVFLQTTQCDHSTLPFTTSTGRLNNVETSTGGLLVPKGNICTDMIY
jgi:hypothetical protein